ncbi:MAG TPA: hypothetical protein EYP56_13060 [Planctomycetaceae bacterium]|nr:hypothetical protein [Planctomycetaceae bacterium]
MNTNSRLFGQFRRWTPAEVVRAYGPLVRRIRQIEGQLRDVPDRGLADRAGRLLRTARPSTTSTGTPVERAGAPTVHAA